METHPEGIYSIYSHALLTWTQTTACSVHPLVLLPLHDPTSKWFHFQTNKERKKNQNTEQLSRGQHVSTWHQKCTSVWLCHIFPRVKCLGIFWSGLLARLKAWTQIFTKLPLHWARETQPQSLCAATDSLCPRANNCTLFRSRRKDLPQGSWQVINTSRGTERALLETYIEIKLSCFTKI